MCICIHTRVHTHRLTFTFPIDLAFTSTLILLVHALTLILAVTVAPALSCIPIHTGNPIHSHALAAAVIIVIFACQLTAYFLCRALCVVCMLCGFVVRYVSSVLSAAMWFSVLPHALCRPFPAVCHL